MAGRCVVGETLNDARRLAYIDAARILPCELVIRDAYHRVVDPRDPRSRQRAGDFGCRVVSP